MAENERWDLHEVPTHFDTEDRWIFGRYTTLEGFSGVVAAGTVYLLSRFFPDLGVVNVREMAVRVTVVLGVVLWLAFVVVFIERWGGERVANKLWRRVFYAVRPKKTVSRPRASASDRRLVAQVTAEEEEAEE